MLKGETLLALPLLQRAVQEWPTYVSAHRMLILALVRLGRLAEAREAATRLLENIPSYHGTGAKFFKNREFATELQHALAISGIAE